MGVEFQISQFLKRELNLGRTSKEKPDKHRRTLMEFLDEIKAAEEQAARQKQEALSQAKTIRQQSRQESRRQVQALKEETEQQIQAIRRQAQEQGEALSHAARQEQEQACRVLEQQAQSRMDAGVKLLLSLLEQPEG